MEGARGPEAYVSEERGHVEAGWWSKGYVIVGKSSKADRDNTIRRALKPETLHFRAGEREVRVAVVEGGTYASGIVGGSVLREGRQEGRTNERCICGKAADSDAVTDDMASAMVLVDRERELLPCIRQRTCRRKELLRTP